MFEELPEHHYRVILADPPWQGYGPHGMAISGMYHTTEDHYHTMCVDEICNLPAGDLAARDSLLLLWARSPRLREALQVMRAWGFEYKTIAFVYVKLDKKSIPIMGLGYWTRTSAEVCLLGKRGKPHRVANNVKQMILTRRREHSRKPDEQYDRIEQMIEGPYLELFARQRRPGWDAWGDEVDKF